MTPLLLGKHRTVMQILQLKSRIKPEVSPRIFASFAAG